MPVALYSSLVRVMQWYKFAMKHWTFKMSSRIALVWNDVIENAFLETTDESISLSSKRESL